MAGAYGVYRNQIKEIYTMSTTVASASALAAFTLFMIVALVNVGANATPASEQVAVAAQTAQING